MSRITKSTHKFFNDHLIQKLNDNKIYTVLDFLNIELQKIVSITNVPYKDISIVRKFLLEKYSTPLRSGQHFYDDYIKNAAIIPTGISSIDKLLEGGMMTGNILEICGFSGSGKTQFCHMLTVNVCYSLDIQVLYVDTKNDFRVSRIKSIIEENKFSGKAQKILENVKVVRPKNIHECLNTLHDLNKTLNKFIRIIIIDSLPALFLPFIGENSTSYRLLNNLANVIKYIATKYQIIFITVNLAKSWIDKENTEDTVCFDLVLFEQSITPGLGKYWQTVPSTRLLFRSDKDDFEKINVKVLKSVNTKSDVRCMVQLSPKGIEDFELDIKQSK